MDTLQRPPTHRDGGRVGRRHTRQVARAHEGREHVAGAPELDAQDGRLGGQKDNARARRPERDVQQQVEHHAHRGRRDARHGHPPLAAQRGQDAHRHKAADARHEAHRADDPHRRHRASECQHLERKTANRDACAPLPAPLETLDPARDHRGLH